MSNSKCPKCNSIPSYFRMDNRKCRECGNTWLGKLDRGLKDRESQASSNTLKRHGIAKTTKELKYSSFTSKFASLDHDIDFSAESSSNTVNKSTQKPINEVLEKANELVKNERKLKTTSKVATEDKHKKMADLEKDKTSHPVVLEKSIFTAFPKTLGGETLNDFTSSLKNPNTVIEDKNTQHGMYKHMSVLGKDKTSYPVALKNSVLTNFPQRLGGETLSKVPSSLRKHNTGPNTIEIIFKEHKTRKNPPRKNNGPKQAPDYEKVLDLKIGEQPSIGPVGVRYQKFNNMNPVKANTKRPRYLDDSSDDDDFTKPTFRVTRKRAKKAEEKEVTKAISSFYNTFTSDSISSTQQHKSIAPSTHMTDDCALPEMLPQPNLNPQQPKDQIKSNEPETKRRSTRSNSKRIVREPTITSAESDDNMSNAPLQEPKNKKTVLLDLVESSADEYVNSDNDDDDDDDDDDSDGSFYDSIAVENKRTVKSNKMSEKPQKSINRTAQPQQSTTSPQNTPSEQQEQTPIKTVEYDSDDPFSDQESGDEKIPNLKELISRMPKVSRITKRENPYLKFFKMESEKLQKGRTTKLPYFKVQSIVSEKYRALSDEEKIKLGKNAQKLKKPGIKAERAKKRATLYKAKNIHTSVLRL